MVQSNLSNQFKKPIHLNLTLLLTELKVLLMSVNVSFFTFFVCNSQIKSMIWIFDGDIIGSSTTYERFNPYYLKRTKDQRISRIYGKTSILIKFDKSWLEIGPFNWSEWDIILNSMKFPSFWLLACQNWLQRVICYKSKKLVQPRKRVPYHTRQYGQYVPYQYMHQYRNSKILYRFKYRPISGVSVGTRHTGLYQKNKNKKFWNFRTL